MPPTVIEKVFVDFIRYDEQIVPARKIRQRLKLRSAEYLPRWVVRRINDDGLGLGRDRLAQAVKEDYERPAREMIATLQMAILEWTDQAGSNDDVTFFAIKALEKTNNAGGAQSPALPIP